MAEQSAQANPAGTGIDGAINDVAINGMTATTKTIQAFACEIAQMSRQALDRATRHIEKLRKAHSTEEVVSIQTGFVKESLEYGAQHTRRLPPEASWCASGRRPGPASASICAVCTAV